MTAMFIVYSRAEEKALMSQLGTSDEKPLEFQGRFAGKSKVNPTRISLLS